MVAPSTSWSSTSHAHHRAHVVVGHPVGADADAEEEAADAEDARLLLGARARAGGGVMDGAHDARSGSDAVQAAVDAIGWGRYQRTLFVVCGLCWCADGGLLLMMPLCLPQLERAFHVTPLAQAVLLSLAGVGAALGAVAFGLAADRVGRRLALATCQAMGIAFSVFGCVSGTLTSLYFCQVGLGAAVGGSIPVAFSLLTEWLPTAQRDESLVLMQVWFKTGVVMEVAMGWVLSSYGWRLVFLFAGAPALLSLVPLLLLCEESAIFLVGAGRTRDASHALATVARWNGKPVPSQATSLHPGSDRSGELTSSSKGTSSPSARTPLSFDRVLSLTSALWLFANLASGLYQWLPELSTSAGASRAANFGSLLAANAVGVAAFVLTAYVLVPRFGYARLLPVACGTCAAFVGAMAAAYALKSLDTLLATYVLWTFAYDVAWPVIYASAPLLFSPDVRSSSFGIASAVGKVGIVLSPWTRVAVNSFGSKPLLLMTLVFMVFWGVTTLVASALHPYLARIKATRHQDGDATAVPAAEH